MGDNEGDIFGAEITRQRRHWLTIGGVGEAFDRDRFYCGNFSNIAWPSTIRVRVRPRLRARTKMAPPQVALLVALPSGRFTARPRVYRRRY